MSANRGGWREWDHAKKDALLYLYFDHRMWFVLTLNSRFPHGLIIQTLPTVRWSPTAYPSTLLGANSVALCARRSV